MATEHVTLLHYMALEIVPSCNRLHRDSATRQTAGNDSKQLLLYTRREKATLNELNSQCQQLT